MTLREKLVEAWKESGISLDVSFADWVRWTADEADVNDYKNELSDAAHRYLRIQEAAPELLAALNRLLHETDGGTDTCGWAVVEDARAAIAKAEDQ
jgi:hypothetical protein